MINFFKSLFQFKSSEERKNNAVALVKQTEEALNAALQLEPFNTELINGLLHKKRQAILAARKEYK